jgi:hypothetical protein
LRARIPAREAIQGKIGAFVNKDKILPINNDLIILDCRGGCGTPPRNDGEEN